VKLLLQAAALLALASLATPARADAYAWGGSSGRFEVHVTVPGFNEGAGVGGWDEGSARDFAGWARRFNAVIPRGASVSLERDAGDDDTTLTIRRRGRVSVSRLPGGPDLDAALALVARRFGARLPGRPAPVRIYTLQVFASVSEASAQRFARLLEERGVAAEGSFFYQACLPCTTHEVHVLDAGAGGIHRVVTGVFDRYATARRSLDELRRRFGLRGFVREIPR
jgi:hypothetical protein